MPYAYEEERAICFCVPAELLHITLERNEVLLTSREVIDTKTVQVSLITITLHAHPSDVFPTRRELRVLVVTNIVFQILLAVLEQGSSKRGSVESCTCDDKKLDAYIMAYRAKQLQLDYEGSNNAAGYYLAILKSLLLVDSFRGMFRITQLGKEVL